MSAHPPFPILYIDGDACPVKKEILRVAERHGLEVYMVSNSGLYPSRNPRVHNIMVSEGPDVADDWIAERALPNDIAITADILLAERCVHNGATVLGPTGKFFTRDNIGSAVAMRSLNAHLRETGESAGYNASFSAKDRSRFLQSLEQAIQDIKRAPQPRPSNPPAAQQKD